MMIDLSTKIGYTIEHRGFILAREKYFADACVKAGTLVTTTVVGETIDVRSNETGKVLYTFYGSVK